MSKTNRVTFTDDSKKEAVRLIGTSGRTIPQIVKDLSVGLSSLSHWKRQFNEADLLANPYEDVTKELACLRKENEIPQQEREILKRSTTFFAKIEEYEIRIQRIVLPTNSR